MDETWASDEAKRLLTKRLVEKTGITEAQARQLVETLGPNWSSLVREANILKKP
jgi:hypothetical protein